MAKKTGKAKRGKAAPRTLDREGFDLLGLRSRRSIPVGLAVLGGALLFAYFVSGIGLGISPDSADYLSAAESLSRGDGLVRFDASAFSSWPPLLPALLSIPEFLGMPTVAVARAMQLLLYASCLGFVVAWGARMGLSRTLLYALAAAVVFVYPPLRVGAMLWSELLFTALTLLTLERLVEAESKADSRALWMAIAAAALAALTRYAGVALVLTGTLYLLSTPRRRPFPALRRALLFGGLSILPLAVWMLRNLRLGEGAMGPRYPSMLTLQETLAYMGDPLPRLYLPQSWGEWLPNVAWLLVFTAIWAALFLLARHARGSTSEVGEEGTRSGTQENRGPEFAATENAAAESAFVLLLFVGVSVSLLTVAISRTAMDRPNFRLLAPMVLPTLLALAALASSTRPRTRPRPRQILGIVVLVLVAVAGAAQLPEHRAEFRERGAGFALPQWRNSALAERIREADLEGQLVSNRPDAVFYLCGLRSQWSPREKSYQSHNLEIQYEELRRFEGLVKARGPSGGIQLAWFDESPSWLLELQTLRSIYQVMVPRAELSDGALFFVPWFEGSAVD